MSFEDSFQIKLGHTSIIVNKYPRKKGVPARSDMLLVRNGKPLAIVETKAPNIKLSEEDRDQGLSYTRLLILQRKVLRNRRR